MLCRDAKTLPLSDKCLEMNFPSEWAHEAEKIYRHWDSAGHQRSTEVAQQKQKEVLPKAILEVNAASVRETTSVCSRETERCNFRRMPELANHIATEMKKVLVKNITTKTLTRHWQLMRAQYLDWPIWSYFWHILTHVWHMYDTIFARMEPQLWQGANMVSLLVLNLNFQSFLERCSSRTKRSLSPQFLSLYIGSQSATEQILRFCYWFTDRWMV